MNRVRARWFHGVDDRANGRHEPRQNGPTNKSPKKKRKAVDAESGSVSVNGHDIANDGVDDGPSDGEANRIENDNDNKKDNKKDVEKKRAPRRRPPKDSRADMRRRILHGVEGGSDLLGLASLYDKSDYSISNSNNNDDDDDDEGDDDDDGEKVVAELEVEEAARRCGIDQEERLNSDPSYLAPFDVDALEYCFDKEEEDNEEEEEKETEKRRTTVPTTPTVKVSLEPRNPSEGPEQHGNSLLVLLCPCCPSRWCLVYPSGELLNKLTIGRIHRPLDDASVSKNDVELDVGERILDIKELCAWGATKAGLLLVRTANYTTLVSIRVQHNGLNGDGDDLGEAECRYEVAEVSRTDLRCLTRSQPSYTPVDTACDPRYGNGFTSPRYAIVSRSLTERNVVHRVVVGAGSRAFCEADRIEKHTIRNLRQIDRVDFSSNHPMVLWSVASSFVRPGREADPMVGRPVAGHGSSLFSIDLRSETGTFQWSPSFEQVMTEGVHSLSGIQTDWDNPFRVWVSSVSAGKVWDMDTRMSCRVVTTWSLHARCSEVSEYVESLNGLHGSGTLLVRPKSDDSCRIGVVDRTRIPMVAVDKDPTTRCFNVFQRPDVPPAFGTDSLECMVPGMEVLSSGERQSVSIARTSTFLLPSTRSFPIGLAAFRTSALSFLTAEELSELGYTAVPKDGMCTVSLTANGDLYTHTLLECPVTERSHSRSMNGMPIGARALRVERKSVDLSRQGENGMAVLGCDTCTDLQVRLSNDPPDTSLTDLPFTFHTKSQLRPFRGWDYSDLQREELSVKGGDLGNNQQDDNDVGSTSVSVWHMGISGPKLLSNQQASASCSGSIGEEGRYSKRATATAMTLGTTEDARTDCSMELVNDASDTLVEEDTDATQEDSTTIAVPKSCMDTAVSELNAMSDRVVYQEDPGTQQDRPGHSDVTDTILSLISNAF